jgi:hypothetical protein
VVHLVKTLGRIKGIQHLELKYVHGSLDFHPCQVVADAVLNSAHSLLTTLQVLVLRDPRYVDQSGIVALANALRQHMAFQEFSWYDFCSPQEAQQDTSLDPVLQALLACPHLRKVSIRTKCASADAVRNLLHSPTVTTLHLSLKLDRWLAVADEIQRGRCDLQNLTLTMFELASSMATETATEALKEIASAIWQDHNLKCLELRMDNCFMDEALAVNKTLHKDVLVDAIAIFRRRPNAAILGVPPMRPLVPCCASILA